MLFIFIGDVIAVKVSHRLSSARSLSEPFFFTFPALQKIQSDEL